MGTAFYQHKTMYKITIIACAVFLLAGCSSKNSQRAAAASGWTNLFNGESTAGWHRYGSPTAGTAWKVEDHVLYIDAVAKDGWQTKNGGDLVTDEEYQNFDLELEWKISKGGNTGIILFVHEDPVKYKYSFETGPEVQILDNEEHPDGKIIKHRTGDLYDLIACNKETVKPVGEWNRTEIKSLNGQLDLYLNGEKVISTMMWDDNWKRMIANSRFKTMPGFGIYNKGHIVLQDHSFPASFRNIRIRRL
jgi:Domain of Unknown Function (DUF1080)